MVDLDNKRFVVVQCDVVKERCSGYFCERSFHAWTGGFVRYGAAEE